MESIFIQTLYHFFVKKIFSKIPVHNQEINGLLWENQEKLHLAKVEVNQIGEL